MLGALIGDIAGSRYERNNHKDKDFDLFGEGCRLTDDSILTLAVAKALMETEKEIKPSVSSFDFDIEYDGRLGQLTVKYLQELGRKYPDAGYGGYFFKWLQQEAPMPYGSSGNGSAMRISPAGLAARTEAEAIRLSQVITEVTHNSEDGLRGAEAVAVAIYMAKTGFLKTEIRRRISLNYYPLDFTIDEIRPDYRFSATCEGSVPQAILCFLEADSFEDAIRTAVSLGGDSDTIAAIAGSIAAAYYGVPLKLRDQALTFLDREQRAIFNEWEVFLGADQESFHLLTKYIPKFSQVGSDRELFDRLTEEELEDEEFWSLEEASDRMGEDSGLVSSFLEEVYSFSKDHPEYELPAYESILKKLGLAWSQEDLASADPEMLDGQSILALLIATIRADYHQEGILREFFESGIILGWLKRLKTLDRQTCGTLQEIYFEIGTAKDTQAYHLNLDGEKAQLKRKQLPSGSSLGDPDYRDDVETVRGWWSALHTEYWSADYQDKSWPPVLDSKQWLLFARYENQRGRIYQGDNAYPPNWELLLELFGIHQE